MDFAVRRPQHIAASHTTEFARRRGRADTGQSASQRRWLSKRKVGDLRTSSRPPWSQRISP
jgi:hypothetical protein